MRPPFIRTIVAALVIAGTGVWVTSCSALLDTEELQKGTPDGTVPEDGTIKDSEPGDGLIDGEPYSAALHLFAPRPTVTRDLAVSSPEPGRHTASFTFRWEDLPGRPADTDLALTLAGSTPLLQIFARGERPFLRAGLKVLPLAAGVSYRLDITIQQQPQQSSLQLALQRLDGLPGREQLALALPPLQLDSARLRLALNATGQDSHRVAINTAAAELPLEALAGRRASQSMAVAAIP